MLNSRALEPNTRRIVVAVVAATLAAAHHGYAFYLSTKHLLDVGRTFPQVCSSRVARSRRSGRGRNCATNTAQGCGPSRARARSPCIACAREKVMRSATSYHSPRGSCRQCRGRATRVSNNALSLSAVVVDKVVHRVGSSRHEDTEAAHGVRSFGTGQAATALSRPAGPSTRAASFASLPPGAAVDTRSVICRAGWPGALCGHTRPRELSQLGFAASDAVEWQAGAQRRSYLLAAGRLSYVQRRLARAAAWRQQVRRRQRALGLAGR